MLNEIQKQDLQGIAALGRNEDTILAHVAPDEMVIPAEVLRNDPFLNTYIYNSISKYGVDPNQFIVGSGDMDLNPLTGLPEFGFLSKVFKKIKKVVKKVAPVAVNFIPGVGPVAKAALTAAAGKASGLSTRDALLAGATSFAGNKMFGGVSPTGGSATTSNIFQRAKEYILPGQDKVGLFGNIRKGIGSFFGGDTTVVQQGDTLSSIAAKEGTTVAELLKANPQITNPNLIQAGATINLPGGGVLSKIGGGLRGIGEGIGGLMPSTDGQSRIGMIEDMIKGRPSDPVREGGGFLGGMMGGGQQQGGGGFLQSLGGAMTSPAGLAGLYGLATYLGAKEREGGLAETPAVTMDSLGRYQLSKTLGTGGTREEFGLGPAPKALKFAQGNVVPSSSEINLVIDALDGTIPQYENEKIIQDFIKKYGIDMFQQISSNVSSRTFYDNNNDFYKEGRAINPSNVVRPGFNTGGAVMMEELDMRQGGESIGPGTGTSDDIPAMLSDGEFVMTAKATRGAGAYETKKTPKGIELIQSGDPSREAGVENMRELMKMFEAV
tara:strand:+ start:1368 stop:3017 length:1650 start_codon:yes stop_codon:yes gene_type:complete